MRNEMLQRIADESALLYPLLGGRVDETAARHGFATRQAAIPM